MPARLDALRERVRTRAEHARNATFVDQLVNAALQEASAEHDWPWLVTRIAPISVATEETALTVWTLPTSGAGGVIHAVYVDDHEIPQRSILDDDFGRGIRDRSWQLGGDGTQTTMASDEAVVFNIKPAVASDASVKVTWKKLEPELTDDADTTLCPDTFAYGPVVTLATAKAYLSDPSEHNAHVFHMREYKRQLNTEAVRLRPSRGTILPRTRPGHRLLET